MKNSARGFTLIELLITASIMAIIALSILAVFVSGLNIYKKTQSVMRTQAGVFFALEIMGRDLKNALNFSQIGFSGNAGEVSFAEAQGGEKLMLGKITYYFDSVKGALFKKEQYYGNSASEIKPLILDNEQIAGLEGFKFSYWYLNEESNKYEWGDSWQKVNEFPRIIKVEADFKDDNKDVKISKRIFMPTAS